MSNSTPLVILCTGANRGIGLAIIQALASHSKTSGASFLLGCRTADKGKEAIDELRGKGIKSSIEPLVLDVTSDESIQDAFGLVQSLYGRLDVLVNNAGYAAIPSSSENSDWRDIYARVYETNVTSVALMMQAFLPLLRKSTGTIINISSARGSAGLASSGALPPTVSVPYSVSKAALNMLTIETSRQAENQKVEFQLVSPGHCKTAFNGYRGTRDPLEGANVVVGLIVAEKGRYKNACFWETKGANVDLVEIPW
ncbi:uncharacterized protein PV06_00675 [Exophiala oligosperma]|uniref:NAD(P)-binding protein n=2 Tax=Chaetothyriales TaxID=34395 RepID=A0A0D2B745_9EURO|nr:uncharacterized protein PV06_00675 [Exophiala oligosperma]KAJ9613681.1 hypothetical protein H2204_014756 [Knufia peltigerae]KIW48046.1 hypothetical protein PV06_00675 [Exophiala oligosperma]